VIVNSLAWKISVFVLCGLYQLLALYRSLSIVRAVKSRNVWLAEYVFLMRDARYIYRILESGLLDIKTLPREIEFEMNETVIWYNDRLCYYTDVEPFSYATPVFVVFHFRMSANRKSLEYILLE
jgi:hypothetical protein